MNIKELLNDAILHNHKSLVLLLDYLLNEIKTLALNEPVLALKFYTANHRQELNEKLTEYIEKRRNDANWICKGMF